jgi:hypothetical protein
MHTLRQLPVLVLLAASVTVVAGCDQASGVAGQTASAPSASPVVTQENTAKARPASPPSSTQDASARPMPPAATPAPQRPSGLPSSGTKEVTFDDIKLELKKEDPYTPEVLTDKVKQLDGQLIRIRGYILPSFQQEGITQFVLVRDNMECCFGPGALLHDCILVQMVAPATATFTVRPVSVEGKFSINPVKDPVNGRYLAIYHLDGKQVR